MTSSTTRLSDQTLSGQPRCWKAAVSLGNSGPEDPQDCGHSIAVYQRRYLFSRGGGT